MGQCPDDACQPGQRTLCAGRCKQRYSRETPPSLRQSASSPKHFPLPHRLHDSSLTTTPSRLSREPHRMHANLTQLASSCQIIPEKVPGAVIRRRPLQEKKTDSCTRVPQASSPRQIQGRENQHGTSRKHSVENKRTRVRRHQQQEHARFRRCTAGPDKARAIPSPTVGKKSTVSGSVPLSTFSLSQGGQEVEVVALPVGLISGGHCAGGSALGWKGEGGLRLLSCGVNVLRAVGRDFRMGRLSTGWNNILPRTFELVGRGVTQGLGSNDHSVGVDERSAVRYTRRNISHDSGWERKSFRRKIIRKYIRHARTHGKTKRIEDPVTWHATDPSSSKR
ncbi:hypothetical protein B0J12DRAFT_151668 [Macrophomina phaseolina]|uniref:Uncharacterized protein n=1 Tax=Macrophomina phaseolina TaxID=35725 RepID=A0ABQ8G7X2_9PEZI|nr:hypothetical protein B0J12DRAFT_151668 [Macrophomina phaseolina]